MVSQFAHVSEVYQTTMAVFVVILAGLEITSFCLEIFHKIQEAQMMGYKDEIKWSQKKDETKEASEQEEIEKSVNVYVQNEITNMENTEGEANSQEPAEKEIKPEELMEKNEKPLSPGREKLLRFYTAYSSFIGEHMSILMPILIVGVLTESTYVFSLAAFFCAIFCSIIFDFLRVEEQLKQQYKRGFVIRRLVKILSGLIILSIFLSYWAIDQYGAAV